MRRVKDPFPPTPADFHLRVERTLGRLEEREMRNTDRTRRLLPLVAAMLALLLAATAAAAIKGRAGLKERLEQEGAREVAELVQEPRISAGAEAGFEFSIDEIIWEDDDLYISYSLAVPEDGNYLVAMFTPTLNGGKLTFDARGWNQPKFFDGEDGVSAALLLGGGHASACGELWTFKVDPQLRARTDNALRFRAVLLRTDLALEGRADWTDVLDPPEYVCFSRNWRDSSDEADAEQAAALDAAAAAFGDDGALTLDEFTGAGIAEYAAERKIDMALDASKLDQTVYDDVAEHDFDLDGVHLHVDAFRMSHLGVRMESTLSVPGAAQDDPAAVARLNDVLERLWEFGTEDGKPLGFSLGGSGSTSWQPLADGTPAYRMHWEDGAIIPLTGLEKLIFAPVTRPDDKNGRQLRPVYDMDRALTLTPIRSGAAAAPEPALTPGEEAALEADLSQ